MGVRPGQGVRWRGVSVQGAQKGMDALSEPQLCLALALSFLLQAVTARCTQSTAASPCMRTGVFLILSQPLAYMLQGLAKVCSSATLTCVRAQV